MSILHPKPTRIPETIAERIASLERAKELLKTPAPMIMTVITGQPYFYGLCAATSVLYGNFTEPSDWAFILSKKPENVEYSPVSYWFPLDDGGLAKRIAILDERIVWLQNQL